MLFHINCQNKTIHSFSSNSKIIAIYQTLDERLSPINHSCDSEINEFHLMDKYDCSFKLGKLGSFKQ